MLIVTEVLLVSGSDFHAVSPTLRYFIRYMMTLDVTAPAGRVIDIDTLHLPIAVIFGVSGFPGLHRATTLVLRVN